MNYLFADIPVYPGGHKKISLIPGCKKYTSRSDIEEIGRFYKTELDRPGWRLLRESGPFNIDFPDFSNMKTMTTMDLDFLEEGKRAVFIYIRSSIEKGIKTSQVSMHGNVALCPFLIGEIVRFSPSRGKSGPDVYPSRGLSPGDFGTITRIIDGLEVETDRSTGPQSWKWFKLAGKNL